MPKWKQNATEFLVSVNFNENRGFQSSIPKPITDFLEIESGDKLEWKMDFDKGKIVTLRKLDSTKKIASKYAKVKKTK